MGNGEKRGKCLVAQLVTDDPTVFFDQSRFMTALSCKIK